MHDHHGHSHGHHHHHHEAPAPSDPRWAIGVGVNLVFVAVEAGFGVYGHSTALLADAGHNLSDVMGLALAGVAAWLARRPPGPRRTYGWGKATVLAALVNAVALVFACGAIAWEAVRRFSDPEPTASGVMMAVAAAGVVVNGLTALLFVKGREDANVRGAFLHMAADAGVSAAVIVAGLLIWVTGKSWIDPAASLVVVAVVLIGTWGLLKEALHLALDGAPAGIDPQKVQACLLEQPGVTAVHDLHVWPISTSEVALTAHLVRPGGADDAFLKHAGDVLHDRFGIAHATLQVETVSIGACERLH